MCWSALGLDSPASVCRARTCGGHNCTDQGQRHGERQRRPSKCVCVCPVRWLCVVLILEMCHSQESGRDVDMCNGSDIAGLMALYMDVMVML